ncbi:GyrI-like domain-containing protein [Rhodomicrobium sp. Az07]|uniref:AraC family transcriptional regulator n=1 Tax=Rhodomicrobium sp. Az07 TaxID=2839034 RepID=UPI001BE88FBB|nr:GyrI-like domain-containing protein [Rhodomicrobium sp. Az07]MBT3069801.1 GyrI-like domain-containing protein [Rhodomicrobium sp. Az07]
MYDISIKTIQPKHLVGLSHRGRYQDIGATFGRLAEIAGARGIDAVMTGCVGVYYDDPGAVPAEELRSLAAFVVGAPMAVEPPLESAMIEGGHYAVLRFVGPYEGLGDAWAWLYSDGLSKLGRPMREGPAFEDYVNDPMNTKPTDLVTDLYVPLA